MPTASTYNYQQESARVVEALRKEFPHDTIKTSEGWHGRVHVKIVSEQFDGKNEAEKQQIVWDILKHYLKRSVKAVSLVLAYGTDEL